MFFLIFFSMIFNIANSCPYFEYAINNTEDKQYTLVTHLTPLDLTMNFKIVYVILHYIEQNPGSKLWPTEIDEYIHIISDNLRKEKYEVKIYQYGTYIVILEEPYCCQSFRVMNKISKARLGVAITGYNFSTGEFSVKVDHQKIIYSRLGAKKRRSGTPKFVQLTQKAKVIYNNDENELKQVQAQSYPNTASKSPKHDAAQIINQQQEIFTVRTKKILEEEKKRSHRKHSATLLRGNPDALGNPTSPKRTSVTGNTISPLELPISPKRPSFSSPTSILNASDTTPPRQDLKKLIEMQREDSFSSTSSRNLDLAT